MTTSTTAETANPGLPILKWVGGKRRLLPHIVKHYSGEETVVEPFFGGGALSFHLAADNPGLRVVANDALAPVMDIYRAVRADAEGFVAAVEKYTEPYISSGEKDERRKFYYEVRNRYAKEELDGPVPLFFLLRCAYSGLYRTSSKHGGRFHTPHGMGDERPGFHHPDRLRSAGKALQRWELTDGDFAETIKRVKPGTFVFLDPPYREAYSKYTHGGFGEDDQLRVVEFFRLADEAGAKVVYTNKSTGDDFYTRHLAGYRIEKVPIRYAVNSNSKKVGHPKSWEVIVSN